MEFVDYETTPETDVLLRIPCAASDLGVHVVSATYYKLGLWGQRYAATVEALVELESTSEVDVLAHPDDERDVIIRIQTL